MNVDNVWNNIITSLKEKSVDVVTVPSNKKEPLWFNAYIENENLFVQNAISCCPSTQMSQSRKISKKDFDIVYSYYRRWSDGEIHLRREVSMLSRNTAYIFGLIARFE